MRFSLKLFAVQWMRKTVCRVLKVVYRIGTEAARTLLADPARLGNPGQGFRGKNRAQTNQIAENRHDRKKMGQAPVVEYPRTVVKFRTIRP
jgi:hypothetical protein